MPLTGLHHVKRCNVPELHTAGIYLQVDNWATVVKEPGLDAESLSNAIATSMLLIAATLTGIAVIIKRIPITRYSSYADEKSEKSVPACVDGSIVNAWSTTPPAEDVIVLEP